MKKSNDSIASIIFACLTAFVITSIVAFIVTTVIGVAITVPKEYIFDFFRDLLPDLPDLPPAQGIATAFPGAVVKGLGGIVKTALFLSLGFMVWQFARIFPNKPVGLYHLQRAIQLIGVPLMLAVIGLSLGLLEGLYFGIGFCLFTPWFLHKGYIKTDKGQILNEHENWPFPDSPIARYTFAAFFMLAGLSTAFS